MKLNKEFKFWDEKDLTTDPTRNLFYWAILSNRIEIAKIFWQLGKVIVFETYRLNLNKV